jgi:transposase-like protein
MKKIPPSEKNRKQLEEILREGIAGENILTTVLQKGMQIIMQEMLEAEVTEFLQRGHYERRGNNDFRGYRNGYERRKIKTAEGEIAIELPQIRQNVEPFRSKLREFFRGNTECLEKLAAEMYARGLSTRDIEDAMIEATGDMILSKASVSKLTKILWEDYERFQKRDLSGYDIEYLFLDGIYESVRKLAGIKEAILVAWGIQRNGEKVLLSLQLGNKESYDSWLEMLRDMVKRGLRIPVSITSDGAPGAIKAIEAIFPRSLRIRCWVHRMKNFSSKVPPVVWPELKAELYQIRDASSYDQGKELAERFIQKYKKTYPTLVGAVSDDLEALLSHLKLPIRHRKSVRTTNLIERSFVEERRRTKIIPGFWTEQSCLKLVFSILIRASKRWNQITMQDMELKQIDALRKELGIDSDKKRSLSTKKRKAVNA